MKKDWEIKKLGEIALFRNGIAHEKEIEKNGKFIVVNSKFVSSNGAIRKYTNECLSPLFKDEIVFVMSDVPKGKTLAKCYIIEENNKYSLNQRICAFSDIKLDLKFFFYCLNRNKYFLSFDNGENQTNLRKNDILNCPFPVPPLEEQKRIVKTLDEKFAQLETIKANAQTNLQNAKDLFQSQLAKAFNNTTWEKAKLEDIALDFSRGKSKHRPRNDKCLFGGDYPFIQTGDIRNADKYVTDYTETYNETGLAQSKLWPAGTLCITIAANIAETAILSFPCCFPDSVIGFIPNEKLTTVDFVYYLIQFFKSELQKLSKGAAQDNLNLAKFENMNFPLPPLPEQKRIVEELDTLSEKVRQLQEIYTNQIANCDELKQSYLQKAFEGEL